MFQNTGYAAATRTTGVPRDIEYHAFSRVTGKLTRAVEDDLPFADLAAALHENMTLWRAIALDIADKSNGLTDQLRAQIFYLFEFTLAHTPKVLKGTADAKALIEINTAIMNGLRPTAPNREAM